MWCVCVNCDAACGSTLSKQLTAAVSEQLHHACSDVFDRLRAEFDQPKIKISAPMRHRLYSYRSPSTRAFNQILYYRVLYIAG